MRKRKMNLRPSPKPYETFDGWSLPTNKDVEPADYPWESTKV